MPSESIPQRLLVHNDSWTITGLVEGPHSIQNQFITWTDTVNKGGPIPHFRKVIASGGNATTNLDATNVIFGDDPGFIQYHRRKRNGDTNFNIDRFVKGNGMLDTGIPAGNPSSISDTTADNLALKRYYDHIAAVDTKFKGLVFAGELRESLNMIRSPARSLRRGISNYLSFLRLKGKGVAKRRRTSFVRDTWLEYSFGWKPLISDIDSAISAFYSSKSVHPIFEMVSGSGENTVLLADVGVQKSYGPLIWTYREKRTSVAYVKYYGIHRSQGNGVANYHSYGFNPAEFIPTLWELIPYSFLVDYFTNIGDIVQSWSYRFISQSWTSRTSVKSYVNRTYGERPTEIPDDAIYTHDVSGLPGSRTVSKQVISRLAAVSPGVPSFELQCPGLSSLKWLNILALSKQSQATSRYLRT